MDFKKETYETTHIRLLADMQWKRILTDHDDYGNKVYEGRHLKQSADMNDTDWYIWKYSMDGESRVGEQGPLIGAWTERAALDWGIVYSVATKPIGEDLVLHSLVSELITQQKITNAYLSIITDDKISEEDLV
jgi:hypothetical protein